MYPKTVSLFLLLTIGLFAFPQRGRLLLVGGGSEKNSATGWNVPAYKWATQGKRVAVIGTSTGSLAPYLTQYCNAAYAREFAVSTRDSADSQVLYDTLMTYQVIFFAVAISMNITARIRTQNCNKRQNNCFCREVHWPVLPPECTSFLRLFLRLKMEPFTHTKPSKIRIIPT